MANSVIQIPNISVSRKIKAEKIPEGAFIHAICWELPVAAEKDGNIIQHIVQEENGIQKNIETGVSETVYRRIEYWEAWEIKKGETSPKQSQSVRSFISEKKRTAPRHSDYDLPMNDIFYRYYPLGSKGTYIINGLAGFYYDALTPDFVVGNKETGAGGLLSTTTKPKFWSFNGLLRKIKFEYDRETEEKSRDDSQQRLYPEVPQKFNASFADNWFTQAASR